MRTMLMTNDIALWELTAYWFAIVTAIVSLGMRATGSVDQGKVYRRLRRPPFAPPSALFGIVWSVLYSGMAVAAARVRNRFEDSDVALTSLVVFLVLQVLLAMYTPLFFRLRALGASAVLVFVSLLVAIGCAFLFFHIDVFAGWILVALCVWLSFAALLATSVWSLNRREPRT